METLQAPLATGSDQSPYQPIDSDAGEIRLVELLPGEYDDPISLSLRTVKLGWWVTDEDDSDSDKDDEDKTYEGDIDKDELNWEESDGWYTYMPRFNREVEYEALSYAWGTTISPHKALVDKFELSITESLDHGLRRLRFGDRPRTLWIDALCINQRDIEERSHQVQHMAAIYRSAENVLIWLGEWPNPAACSHPEDCQALLLSLLQEVGRGRRPPQVPNHIRDHCGEIMEFPWFRRLWVIQELALARRDPIVLIGSMSTSWSDLSETVIMIALSSGSRFPDGCQLDDKSDSYSPVSAMAHIRSRSGSHRSLYWCLIASQSAMSTDPRDKVYGLLGLCDSQLAEAMVVDYSKSLRQILAEATVVSILEESAFPYLNEGTRPTGGFDRTHWTNSSWVLDFTYIPTDVLLESVPNSELDMEERNERQGSIRLSMDYQTLYAHGRYIGTICETQNSSWSWGSDDTGFRDQTTNTEIYDFYHNILRPRDISPRTLLQLLRRRRIDDEDLDHFVSLLLGSRDGFRLNFTLNIYCDEFENAISAENLGHFGGRDIIVTEEGHIGVSFHRDCRLVHKGAILVCLFGIEVPFILAPIPGTELHEMINIAYVPGYGDRMLDRYDPSSHRATWIDFATEGGKEYAIV